MNDFIVEKLTKTVGDKTVFKNISFIIHDLDRIGLIGVNGTGKTTLLNVLSGKSGFDGDVNPFSAHSDYKIGYLTQDPHFDDDRTVLDTVLSSTLREIQLIREYELLLSNYDENNQSRLEKVMAEMDALQAWEIESQVKTVLSKLGLDDLSAKVGDLSGGLRRRVQLAQVLLGDDDLLLLDEPTNHLDIESIQWLEQFLAQSAKAVVLVSHDRAFINNVTNRTLEITCGRVEDYKVKYDEYLVLRKERREQQMRAYENQQKEIADIKAFIDRFRYQATKAVQVQQRIKQLEKIVPIEVDEVDNSAMRLKFPPCLRSGDYPVICDNVRKEYPPRLVFDKVDMTIKRGEKVAFVGKNGEGKSTLVKCIMGEIPFDGNLKIGHNVQIGYFAQNQAQLLDENLTIFETIDQVAKGDMRLKINDLLGAFMFGGETSEKKVKVLSGGERSRLAMIKLLLEPVNLLILDEPTNHLDITSKEVLKEAIKAFDGTAIIVSHDREFLDGLVSKVYEFGGGKVREHLGGIYDYLRAHNAETIQESLSKASANNINKEAETIVNTNHETATQPSSGAASYAERKEQQKKIRKAQRAVEDSEKKIAKMEERKAELDELLMVAENASNMELVTEYTDLQRHLDKENEQWLELSEALERLLDE